MGGPALPDQPAASSGARERLLARGYQGAVYLVQSPSGPLIVKKASGRGLLRAARLAMLRREHAIYQRLQGIVGVPASHGLDMQGHLRLEFVAGCSLREAELSGAERERFFAALRDLILRVHGAGVAHGDLKRKDNIMVGPAGQPFLIDFGTALAAPPGAGWLRRLVWHQMCRVDLNAWIKLKYQRQDGDIDPADRLFYRPTLPERLARPLRQGWRRLTLRRWRKGRQRSQP